MVHRLLAGLLALGFLVDPISGVFAWIHFEKAIVRGEVRRHIISGADKNGLVVLEFSKMETESLLRWEHSREFEYNGQMYDIVESWASGRHRVLPVLVGPGGDEAERPAERARRAGLWGRPQDRRQ